MHAALLYVLEQQQAMMDGQTCTTSQQLKETIKVCVPHAWLNIASTA